MAKITLPLTLLLGACALFPLSEADCRPANWRQRGYDDGYFGNNPQIMRMARECGRMGIQVAEADYMEGWRVGYDEYDRLMGSFKKMSNR